MRGVRLVARAREMIRATLSGVSAAEARSERPRKIHSPMPLDKRVGGEVMG